MLEALIGAMDHSAKLQKELNNTDPEPIVHFTSNLRKAVHATFRLGEGTRDMHGPSGVTTEKFVDIVAARLGRYLVGNFAEDSDSKAIEHVERDVENVDTAALKGLFDKYDIDGNGIIDYEEFEQMIVSLGVAPTVVKDQE